MNTANNRLLQTAMVWGLIATSPLGAQVRLFPGVSRFEYPIGSVRSSGIVGRVVSERLGVTRFGPEREADVLIGTNLPVLGFGSTQRAFLGLTMRVGGRFSLDDPKSSLLGNDWVVGIHGVVDRGPWRVTGEIYHESSHLGDEYAERSQARRIDWTREVGGLWIRRSAGAFEFTVMGARTLIDELPLGRGAFGAGAGYHGNGGGWLGARVRPYAGVYAESVEYAGWKVTTTARAGVDLDAGGRRLGLGAVFLNGLSNQRQFYDRRSRYVGFELRFDF